MLSEQLPGFEFGKSLYSSKNISAVGPQRVNYTGGGCVGPLVWEVLHVHSCPPPTR